MPVEPATSMLDTPSAALSVRGLTKRFGGTAALQDVTFDVGAGEIHALLGANGAGKSTLIKILAGVHRADAGEVFVKGVPLVEAMKLRRISFVHQDLALIDSMSVAENMAMGYGYAMHYRLIDWKAVLSMARRAFAMLDAPPVRFDQPVATLTPAEKSVVAIARALTDGVDLLVLDEPTASLPEADVGRLFRVLDRLRQHKVSIVYVTHRLDEVFRITDAVTVLRDGRVAASYSSSRIPPEQIVADIVGKSLLRRTFQSRRCGDITTLAVSNLKVGHVGPISFTINRGEILGLAGLRGQGQEEIGRALGGAIRADSGSIQLGGHEVHARGTAAAIRAGIAFATSRRAEEALAPMLTVKENLFLNPLNFGRKSWIPRLRRRERADAAAIMRKFRVRPTNPDREISTLSGGNQQKVVLARWADQRYKVLVLEEPTMGVDVGAKEEIYRMLSDDAASGTSCIVVSSDLDELVQICDRVLAFGRGRIVGEINRTSLTVQALTREVSGVGQVSSSQSPS